MTRLKAFLIHLGISLLIFTALLYIIVYHWYPAPFFSTDGGWQGLRIIAIVDIVLGPVLTLVVFNPKKERSKTRFDLTVIGIIQFAALLSGAWVVHHERPVAKVIAEGIISPVTAYDLIDNNLELRNLEKFRSADTLTIYTDLPDDFTEMQKILVKSFRENKPLFLQTQLYKKIDESVIKKLELFSINMDKYLEGNEKRQKIYRTFLQQQGKTADEFLFLSLHSRYAFTIAVFDKNTLEFVDVLTKIPSPPVEIMDKLIQFKRVYIPSEEEKSRLKEKSEGEK